VLLTYGSLSADKGLKPDGKRCACVVTLAFDLTLICSLAIASEELGTRIKCCCKMVAGTHSLSVLVIFVTRIRRTDTSQALKMACCRTRAK